MKFIITTLRIILLLSSVLIFLLYLDIGNFSTLFLSIILFVFMLKSNNACRKKIINMDTVDKMEGLDFEEYISLLYQALGYITKVTVGSGDYGADVIAKNDDEVIAIQCKRYKNKVGIEAVQQIIGALAVYQADRGVVITNSVYTPAAITLAKANRIELIDRSKLISLIENNL